MPKSVQENEKNKIPRNSEKQTVHLNPDRSPDLELIKIKKSKLFHTGQVQWGK